MHLSIRTRMTENDGVGRHRKRAYACRISRDGPGPDGCCARVRINLRLLVKTRALSFHLCAGWFARLASSNVCVSGPRLRLCWCWDIYMRCRRGRRSGTPVDFLPREREGKRESNPRHFLAFYLFWNERRKPPVQHNLYRFCRVLILLATRVIFLRRWEMTFEFWQVEFRQFSNIMLCDIFFILRKETEGEFPWKHWNYFYFVRYCFSRKDAIILS